MRLWVTPELRETEAGSLILGMNVQPKGMLIPPQQRRFVLYAFCDALCTQALPAPSPSPSPVPSRSSPLPALP